MASGDRAVAGLVAARPSRLSKSEHERSMISRPYQVRSGSVKYELLRCLNVLVLKAASDLACVLHVKLAWTGENNVEVRNSVWQRWHRRSIGFSQGLASVQAGPGPESDAYVPTRAPPGCGFEVSTSPDDPKEKQELQQRVWISKSA